MISRRRILSRPRDVLFNNNSQFPVDYIAGEEEEDVWYSKDKLYKDHILEIYDKWGNIDDEIWAKIIVLERNRRIAKAYARAPILTINGSVNGFDGYRIGLNGFDNPLRDPKTEMTKQSVGDGVKIRMDDNGNILVKRLSKSHVYVKGWRQVYNSKKNNPKLCNEMVPSNGLLEINKTACLFDMNQFQSCMSVELRRSYPDKTKLENQCICFIAFGKDGPDQLDLPIWVMVINVVALDMLKSRFQIMPKQQSVPNIVLALEHQKSLTREEDPYSLPGNNSSSSDSHTSGHYSSAGQFPTQKLTPKQRIVEPKPPKLPPRDFECKQNSKSKYFEKSSKSKAVESSSIFQNLSNGLVHDDPYYCGFIARVPNYTRTPQKKDISSKQMLDSPRFKSNYNSQEQHSQKMSSKGFLNSVLKSNQPSNKGINSTYDSFVGYNAMLSNGPAEENIAIYAQSMYGSIGTAQSYDEISKGRKKSKVPHWSWY